METGAEDYYPPPINQSNMTITIPQNILEMLPLARFHLFGIILLCILGATLLAVLLDLRDGVATAKRCGQDIHSHKLRVTVGKIIEYWQFIFLAFLADAVGAFMPFFGLPYITILFGFAVIFIEGKSMLEHAKRRKSGAAKLPSAVAEIVEIVGGADELRSLIADMARRHAERNAATEQDSELITPIL